MLPFNVEPPGRFWNPIEFLTMDSGVKTFSMLRLRTLGCDKSTSGHVFILTDEQITGRGAERSQPCCKQINSVAARQGNCREEPIVHEVTAN
jgi:hypothetical protein